jgi:hypothetical protein
MVAVTWKIAANGIDQLKHEKMAEQICKRLRERVV